LNKDQQDQVRTLENRIPTLSDALKDVQTAEAECSAANVDENDYTVFTCQDLEFELGLFVQSVSKKIAFLDNQASTLLGAEPAMLNMGNPDCLPKHE
jgi:hypothetical protein